VEAAVTLAAGVEAAEEAVAAAVTLAVAEEEAATGEEACGRSQEMCDPLGVQIGLLVVQALKVLPRDLRCICRIRAVTGRCLRMGYGP
jgi:hypothetical protein